MSNETERSPFEERAAALLRESAESLDAATRSRLTQARHAALESARARPAWLDLRVLAPSGAIAAAAVMALLLWGGVGQRASSDMSGPLDDLELLADSDGYDLTQETDLEFIEWAAAMGEQDGAGT
jgi:hypothetical protein